MWVVRTSLTSPAAVRNVVWTAVKYGLNTLFVQVRGRGDAWYVSPYEPRAEQLSGRAADFDPLQLIVELAHAQGIQVHAWLNTYLAWSGPRPPSNPTHVWNAHRDWFACDRQGRCSPLPTRSSEGAFLQPSHPAVREHLTRVFTHVATHYDVDGIHFDYCRYSGSDYDFSTGALARFQDYLAPEISPELAARLAKRRAQDRLAWVHACPARWADWRRAQLTGTVAQISSEIRKVKPWLQISAAVFANSRDAYHTRGQDWAGWLKAGYLDAVALMSYDKNTERIVEQTRQAVTLAGERHIYTGIGAWRLPASDVAQKIVQARKAGASGINLFSYDGMRTRAQYLDTLARGVFASRAAPPRMRWLPPREPASSTELR